MIIHVQKITVASSVLISSFYNQTQHINKLYVGTVVLTRSRVSPFSFLTLSLLAATHPMVIGTVLEVGGLDHGFRFCTFSSGRERDGAKKLPITDLILSRLRQALVELERQMHTLIIQFKCGGDRTPSL